MNDSNIKAPFRALSAHRKAYWRSVLTSSRHKWWLYALVLSLGLAACTTSTSEVSEVSEVSDSLSSAATASPAVTDEPVSSDPVSSNDLAATPAPATRLPASKYDDLEIVTLLPRDAIPAIDNPQFLTAEEADRFYDPDELVMGVSFSGVTRAYSVPFLSNHEIVNDTVGGVKIAVTW